MIDPPSLRRAIGSYLYVEHNLDEGFATELGSGYGEFDDEMRLGLARILVRGDMDFGDFVEVTDNAAMRDGQILERLQKIWDAAFPGVDPRLYVEASAAGPRAPRASRT